MHIYHCFCKPSQTASADMLCCICGKTKRELETTYEAIKYPIMGSIDERYAN